MSDLSEVKSLIDKQGEAFEAFKGTLAELKKADVVTAEKMTKIEASLDAAVEAKAKIEAKLAAEAREREALELRLSRAGGKGDDKGEAEIKSFSNLVRAEAAARGRQVAEQSADDYRAYKSAFEHYMRSGKDNLDPTEVKTMSVGSDPDGGYLVTPDSSGRMAIKIFETSEIRQLASVQVISTGALEGIEDTGDAGAGYAGESATSGNSTTPQIGKWSIPVFPIDTEPKATQTLLDDANVDVGAWLEGKAAEKIGRFENVEFCTGATKIRGFAGGYTTAADSGSGVTWGTIGHIMSGASADFTATNPADKLLDLMGLLKNAYLANARWVTRRTVISLIRKFKMASANPTYALWMPGMTVGQAETILGHPVTRAEDMPTLAADSLSLAFGDFRAAYQIVDRQGVRVMRDPYTAKPFVKFYTTKRTGGGVVNFEAIKLMKFNS